MTNNFQRFHEKLRVLQSERDSNNFHIQKNLAMTMSAQCAEVSELFEWMAADHTEGGTLARQKVFAPKIAEVMIYGIRLADVMGFDIVGAIDRRIEKDEQRYPTEDRNGAPRRAADKAGATSSSSMEDSSRKVLDALASAERDAEADWKEITR